MSKHKQFNYVIAHYWDDGEGIGAYTYFNNEIHFGTLKEAKQFLEYVKVQSPDEDWRIFEVKELCV